MAMDDARKTVGALTEDIEECGRRVVGGDVP